MPSARGGLKRASDPLKLTDVCEPSYGCWKLILSSGSGSCALFQPGYDLEQGFQFLCTIVEMDSWAKEGKSMWAK